MMYCNVDCRHERNVACSAQFDATKVVVGLHFALNFEKKNRSIIIIRGVTLNSPGLNFVVRDYKFVVQDYMK